MIQEPTFWAVLGAALVLYWLIPLRLRMGFLAAVSFAYLLKMFKGELTYAALFVIWSGLFYGLSHKAGKDGGWRRWVVPGLVTGILGWLAYYKYVPPVIAALASSEVERNVVIPIGISYFTFKLIHYAVEVGRGNIKDRSPATFFCYVFLFPIFTAGPIERFDHFLANREPHLTQASLVEGFTRIIHGLIKKFVIADMFLTLGISDLQLWQVIQDPSLGAATLWRYAIFSYLIMYLDFSAYSDVAIGSSRLFGLKIQENFNWPIFASNISDFWKRWHMTLANWCMSYIYMPVLGLRRNPYLAAYATFILMGLWHAGSLNWVMWGVWHATGLVSYQWWGRYRRQKKWAFFNSRTWSYICVPITFLFITGGFIFTLVHGFGGVMDSFRVLAVMFGVSNISS